MSCIHLFNNKISSARGATINTVSMVIGTDCIGSCKSKRCTTLCDKLCQCLAACRWFSPGTPVSFTNKTDHHDIAEILLKVALKTINQIYD